MQLNWKHKGSEVATFVVGLLCVSPVAAQSHNPWNPYPSQQAQPVPAPPPAPQPKYFEEAPLPNNPAQSAANSISRFAPADLDRQLSAGPQTPPFSPYGYQGAQIPPNANPQAYFGPPQGGFPQGYPMGGPFNYGGYGPPIIGNNGWGGMPGNNFSPFGFW